MLNVAYRARVSVNTGALNFFPSSFFPFLGSGPVGDDDLWHHDIGRFSPFLGSGPVGDNDLWYHHIL